MEMVRKNIFNFKFLILIIVLGADSNFLTKVEGAIDWIFGDGGRFVVLYFRLCP